MLRTHLPARPKLKPERRSARHAALWLAMLGGLALSTTARAQFEEMNDVQLEPGPKQGAGRLGAALINRPAYLGSDDRVTRLAPVISYQWANGFFAGLSNGLGYNFSQERGRQYGVRLGAAPGRKESASPDLAGMGDIKTSLTVGAFYNMALSRQLRLSSELRVGGGENNRGLQFSQGLSFIQPLAPGWILSLGTHLSFANGELMQTHFGVSETQSSSSGYDVYQARAGLRDWRNRVALIHPFGPGFVVIGSIGSTTLLGDAADSPLTRQATSASSVLAFAWRY